MARSDEERRADMLREAAVSLEALLDGITEDNLHEATDWGAPRGKEVW